MATVEEEALSPRGPKSATRKQRVSREEPGGSGDKKKERSASLTSSVPLSPIPSMELLALRDELAQTQQSLRREQSENKLIRSNVQTLERQLAELQQWQGNEQSFESDVAAAIQFAQRADYSRDAEITKLREEISQMKTSYEGSDAKRLQETVVKLEGSHRACQVELERHKKDLLAERVSSAFE